MEPSIRVSREDLVQTLERQILNGVIPVGGSLPSERRLAAQFHVSRTVVREALSILAERQLIEVEIGRGAFVGAADPTAASSVLVNAMRGRHVTARHVIHGRKILESETAWLAAEQRTAEDIDRMERAIEPLEKQGPLMGRVQLDLAFHLAVARACHDPVLEAMFGAISGLTAELMLRSLSDSTVASLAIPQHRQILDAIKLQDAAQAKHWMLEHLDVAARHYGEDLDRDLDTVAERQLKDVVGANHSLDELFRLAMRSTPVADG